MRMFHQQHLGPASPIRFKNYHELEIDLDPETENPKINVESFYEVDYKNLEAVPDASIPLLVASYDLEMYSSTGLFPQASKDPIVQIGLSYRWTDDMLEPVCRVVFVNGTVEQSNEPNTSFVSCKDEADMLIQFARHIQHNNPDIMCGYNIFGFDDQYIEERCKKLKILDEVQLGRCKSINYDFKTQKFSTKFAESKSFELASGKYDLRFLAIRGRLGLDLLLNMRREHSLDSFKLDNVANTFLRGKVLEFKNNTITTQTTRGLRNTNYVKFEFVGNTKEPLYEGEKFEVYDVTPTSFKVRSAHKLFEGIELKSIEWTFTKDDVEPHELFRLHRGTPADRARIARYCAQDCDLVLTLMAKLDTLVNARGMADVCKVPVEFVLRRGLGIRIFSVVA